MENLVPIIPVTATRVTVLQQVNNARPSGVKVSPINKMQMILSILTIISLKCAENIPGEHFSDNCSIHRYL